jgi:stage V sporulation protein G
MEISDIRVRIVGDPDERLKAVCSITLAGEFVVRDIKVVEGATGLFVAMPSRKLTAACPKCRTQNHLRARCCNDCGAKLPPARIPADANGREKSHRDIAHPINATFRQELQARVIAAYEDAVANVDDSGEELRYPEPEEEYDTQEEQPISEYDSLIADLKGRGEGRDRDDTRGNLREGPRGAPRQESRPQSSSGERGGRGERGDRGDRGGRGGDRDRGRSDRGRGEGGGPPPRDRDRAPAAGRGREEPRGRDDSRGRQEDTRRTGGPGVGGPPKREFVPKEIEDDDRARRRAELQAEYDSAFGAGMDEAEREPMAEAPKPYTPPVRERTVSRESVRPSKASPPRETPLRETPPRETPTREGASRDSSRPAPSVKPQPQPATEASDDDSDAPFGAGIL